MSRGKIIIVAVVCLLGVIIYSLIDFIPDNDLTKSRMVSISIRIQQYYADTGTIPDSLNELPLRDGFDNSIVDAWGNDFKITVTENSKLCVITSFGEDGKAGTSDDVSYEFNVEAEDRVVDIE